MSGRAGMRMRRSGGGGGARGHVRGFSRAQVADNNSGEQRLRQTKTRMGEVAANIWCARCIHGVVMLHDSVDIIDPDG